MVSFAFQKIYSNTSAMLVWEIERNFIGRRDLALTYYPSAFEFYWFISRTLVLLERHARAKKSLPTVSRCNKKYTIMSCQLHKPFILEYLNLAASLYNLYHDYCYP